VSELIINLNLSTFQMADEDYWQETAQMYEQLI